MQPEKQQKSSDICKEFRTTFNRIDYFSHVKEFKSLMETKLTHIDVTSESKKNKPPDFYTQMRRLFLQMIYLYYVAYYKKMDIYVYNRYCINRWGVIFKYYSLDSACTFMQKINHEQFVQNISELFKEIWQFKTKEEEQHENEENDKEGEAQNQENEKNKKKDKNDKNQKAEEVPFNNWVGFAHRFIDAYGKLVNENFTPKEFLARLQETKHARNNIMIIGVMTSTIFPLIKLNKFIQRVHFEICEYEPYIISRIFGDQLPDEAITEFTISIIRFFKALSDHKVLAITSTVSESKKPKFSEGESLLAEFKLNLDRVSTQKQEAQKNQTLPEQQKVNNNSGNSQSKSNSENDYNTQNEVKKNKNDNDLGEVVCHYFWNKQKNQKELTFRVTISIDKRICPLYWREVQDIWAKLSEKWKVILDENKQLSGFNPGFVMMNCNKDSLTHQVTFTEYLKCQPIQSAISQLIITTDKLIIVALAMRDILCYFERKSDEGQIVRQELVLNPGRMEDLARSVCQSIKNYYGCCKEVMAKVHKHKLENQPHN